MFICDQQRFSSEINFSFNFYTVQLILIIVFAVVVLFSQDLFFVSIQFLRK